MRWYWLQSLADSGWLWLADCPSGYLSVLITTACCIGSLASLSSSHYLYTRRLFPFRSSHSIGPIKFKNIYIYEVIFSVCFVCFPVSSWCDVMCVKILIFFVSLSFSAAHYHLILSHDIIIFALLSFWIIKYGFVCLFFFCFQNTRNISVWFCMFFVHD